MQRATQRLATEFSNPAVVVAEQTDCAIGARDVKAKLSVFHAFGGLPLAFRDLYCEPL